MTKPSPWKKDPETRISNPEKFRFEISSHEVRRLIEMLERMTPSAEHGFYILLATMLHMADQNGTSKEHLVEMLTEEILAHKVVKS